jgi:hypothetical protein
MVHGAMYYQTSHHIDFHIQMFLAVNMIMYLRHADLSNAFDFAKAEHPHQM